MKNWQKIADQEFKNMDAEEQASFADLRRRVMKH